MNRKLHNTVMAMIASSSLFVLGLLTAGPASPAEGVASQDRTGKVVATPRRHLRRTHRQSVAMPFFSFAPRG